MKKSNLLFIASVMALTVAGAANAQTAAPATAAPAPPTPPTFGAAVPGQCVLDEQTAMGTSKMGVAAAGRLSQLKGVVDGELQQQGQALEAEYKQLAATQKTSYATPAGKQGWDGKAEAWGKKRDAFQAKVQQRQQEMQYTQQEVMSAIFSKMIPNINAVVTAKGCSTVVAASSLVHYDLNNNAAGQPTQSTFTYVNPAMDITSAVVQKMDSTNELLPAFERVSLDQQAAGAPAAPAAPRAGATGAAPRK